MNTDPTLHPRNHRTHNWAEPPQYVTQLPATKGEQRAYARGCIHGIVYASAVMTITVLAMWAGGFL